MIKLEGNHKTHIRMSKIERALQTAMTNTNLKEIAKILFWGDCDPGRRSEVGRLLSERNKKLTNPSGNASYDKDQLQYLLTMLLIVTIAEKRIENLYQQDFAQRCDRISEQHGLKQNQYWTDEEIPSEWKTLDTEFEAQSFQILLETLKEYNLGEIADRVSKDGSKQLYDIVASLKNQFLKVLKDSAAGNSTATPAQSGSIPETLQSSQP